MSSEAEKLCPKCGEKFTHESMSICKDCYAFWKASRFQEYAEWKASEYRRCGIENPAFVRGGK